MARRPQCYRRKTDYDMHVERTAQYMYGTPAGQFTGSMCVNYGILRRECKSSGELPQLIGYTERGGRYKRRWAGRSKTNYSNTEGRGKLGMYGMATVQATVQTPGPRFEKWIPYWEKGSPFCCSKSIRRPLMGAGFSYIADPSTSMYALCLVCPRLLLP